MRVTMPVVVTIHDATFFTEPAMLAREMSDVLEGFANGSFRPVVDAEVPLAEATRAHERMERRENFGKVVLVS